MTYESLLRSRTSTMTYFITFSAPTPTGLRRPYLNGNSPFFTHSVHREAQDARISRRKQQNGHHGPWQAIIRLILSNSSVICSAEDYVAMLLEVCTQGDGKACVKALMNVSLIWPRIWLRTIVGASQDWHPHFRPQIDQHDAHAGQFEAQDAVLGGGPQIGPQNVQARRQREHRLDKQGIQEPNGGARVRDVLREHHGDLQHRKWTS